MARRGHVGPAQRGPWRPHSLPGYYAGGVTAESSWDEILKARGVQPQWPQLGFGNAMVPISNVCLSKDDDTLAIADRRSDNGVRLSADEFREQARVAMAKGPVTRRDQLARLAGSVPGGGKCAGGWPHPLSGQRVQGPSEQQGTGDRVPLREAMEAGDLQRPVARVSRGAGGQGGTGNRDSVRVT
jgi:hypothetical protein